MTASEMLERFERNGVPGEETLTRISVAPKGGHNQDGDQGGDEWDEGDDDGYAYVGESDGGDEGDTQGYDPGSIDGYQLTASSWLRQMMYNEQEIELLSGRLLPSSPKSRTWER